MEHIELLSTVFKVHNKRESLMLSLIKNNVNHVLQLEDIEYMRTIQSDWSFSDNERAIENNLRDINAQLLCCYYLDMIEEPFKQIYSIDKLKELLQTFTCYT